MMSGSLYLLVCLSVTARAYLRNQTSSVLSMSPVAKSSSDDVKYFRFCGRCHIFILRIEWRMCIFCAFVFHTAYMLCYCQHRGVNLVGLKPSP